MRPSPSLRSPLRLWQSIMQILKKLSQWNRTDKNLFIKILLLFKCGIVTFAILDYGLPQLLMKSRNDEKQNNNGISITSIIANKVKSIILQKLAFTIESLR